MTDRDEYAEKMKRKIDEWNAEIDKLEGKAREASGEWEQKYNEQLAEMRKYRDEAEEKYDELRRQSAENWAKWEADAKAAWSDIADGFQKAWRRFS
jgi:uncharacterized coiled-coil DUF342 family protein